MNDDSEPAAEPGLAELRNIARVPHSLVFEKINDIDVYNIRQFIREIHGAYGHELIHLLKVVDIDEDEILSYRKKISVEFFDTMTNTELSRLIIYCNIAASALGEREISTITSVGRDEFYLTRRRLFLLLRKRIRNFEKSVS